MTTTYSSMGSMCEPLDLSSFGPPDLWYQQLVFEGFQSGVPTNTTPTLTPTTLRTLEQSLISMNADDTSYHNEAGFVPPIVQPSTTAGSICLNVMNPTTLQGGSTTVMPCMPTQTLSRARVASSINTSVADSVGLCQPATSVASSTVRKNVGGRRPTKAQGISPEEEERRQIRRERNKAAAARCRKRRMDQTTSLEMVGLRCGIKHLKSKKKKNNSETKGLEDKRQQLQQEIRDLTRQKEELHQVLTTHKITNCKMAVSSDSPDHVMSLSCGPNSPPDVKPLIALPNDAPDRSCLQGYQIKQELHDQSNLYMTQQQHFGQPSPAKRANMNIGNARPLRPTSLPVAAAFTPAQSILRGPSNLSEVAGIPISTPSTGIVNFDSLMEGGTGLTPVSGPLIPSCSSQQRNHNCGDLSSPDSSISNKLVSL